MSKGPGLPDVLWAHCRVKLNNTHMMLSGGEDANKMQSNATYLIEWETWTWTKIADMNYLRTWHHCASIKGTVYVFSFRHNENDPFIPYEKYDAATDMWIVGKILSMQPFSVNTKIIQYENSAVMMVYEPPTTKVYKFDTKYEDWVKTDMIFRGHYRSNAYVALPCH